MSMYNVLCVCIQQRLFVSELLDFDEGIVKVGRQSVGCVSFIG